MNYTIKINCGRSLPRNKHQMKRPESKDFYPKDFLNGKYEKALEAYIDYLEKEKEKLDNRLETLRINLDYTS